MKSIRSRRQRETDYENEEKQLLEVMLFDSETSGVFLTFWDTEQIKVINALHEVKQSSLNENFSLLNVGYPKSISSFVLQFAFDTMSIEKYMALRLLEIVYSQSIQVGIDSMRNFYVKE